MHGGGVLNALDLPKSTGNEQLIGALKDLKNDYDELSTQHELYADDLEMLMLARGDDDL